MKKPTLAILAFLSFAACAATPKLDVPYTPGDDVRTLVQTAPGWAEYYKVAPAEETGAVKALVEKSTTPPPLAVDVSGRLYFSQEGSPGEVGETSWSVTRKGERIEYDDDCKVRPTRGDVLETVYQSMDGEVEIIARTVVREHYAFGYVGNATEPSRLNLAKKEHCDAVIESRLLSTGTLTFKVKGRVAFREPVLLQTIAQP